VISDRYSDSRFAYQAATLAASDVDIDRPLEYIKGIHAAFSRPPDATTIYLDLDAREAAERAGRTNKFEQDGYLAAVRKNYERLIDAEPDRFVRIDDALAVAGGGHRAGRGGSVGVAGRVVRRRAQR